ncbi:MAG: protein-L-isoaspartate(D-aspartate) O-methyltransferase [Flavobacteriales bacterium]|nr:protein-L-isoaspartate(D-aspartate) O-methyltransferase [Flavobacteriales bacterium]
MKDLRFQGLRNKLVNQLKTKGINDKKVLDAISKVPRHLFFDEVFQNQFAYEDVAFPIGQDQTISQPYTVAFQSEMLNVKKGHKVLEIGTGSGYQTAVLCFLGAKVYSIERQKPLFEKASIFLSENGYRANLFFGDGFKGKKVFAPYDSIIVTCGAPFVPNDLKMQLKIGGRMVIPVGDGDVQQMKLIVRSKGDVFKETTYGEFKFVPMLKNKNN